MVPELILHHYDFSNYSEKVRLVLGLKGMAWRSVEIPAHLPKPDFIPLTAGYRRAPALQIGADVYCDTRLIIEVLEARQAEPTLYPGDDPARTRALSDALTAWAETHLQRPLALYITGLHAEDFAAEFHADRAQLHGKAQPSLAQVKKSALKYQAQVEIQLTWIEAMLGDAYPYLLGAQPTLADISVYQAPWFLDVIDRNNGLTEHLPRLQAWRKRVAALGHGQREEFSAAAALAVARAVQPAETLVTTTAVPEGVAVGDTVTVSPFDQYSPASGVLCAINNQRITVMTESAVCGQLHIHFPRLGYRVRRATH